MSTSLEAGDMPPPQDDTKNGDKIDGEERSSIRRPSEGQPESMANPPPKQRRNRRASHLDNLIADKARMSEVTAAAAAATTTEASMSTERLRRISQRMSVYQAKMGRERLVEVRLQDVSYHVPVRADAPSIPTFYNQTIFYKFYKFCRRIHLYRVWKNTKDAVENTWNPESAEEIFLPYRKKTILHNINLVLKPGTSYLILGPPGCGKTSLLKAIAGNLPGSKTDALKDKPYFEGRVEYNGLASQDDPNMVLPNIASYVQQHDYHAARLTVKETFEFAFQCRTGGTHKNMAGVENSTAGSEMDRERLSENLTIEGLDLAHVADTFVGDDNIRGVSGGQRRRVTVGEMMQSQNPVACADEISTGLDAAVTFDICQSIVTFAKAAKTTRVVALLQPGPEVFSLFDEVIILADGYLVYAGPVDDVEEYFEDLGYTSPATVDVADFLQSLPTPDGELYYKAPEGSDKKHFSSEQFALAFQESDIGKDLIAELNSVHAVKWKAKKESEASDEETARLVVPTPDEFKKEFQNSWGRSFMLNLNRHITLWKRDKGFIIGKACENVGMAVATGGILFGQAKVTWDDGVVLDQETADKAIKLMSAVYGALYMACFHIVQGSSTSAPDELDGRAIHYKHADANFYQSLSFAMARLVSTFPQRAIDITAFGVPVYWMVGFTAQAGAFFIYLLFLFMLIVTEKILFGITTALLKTKQSVLGVGSFIVLMQCLFGGFIVYPDAIPNYYLWAYYINPMAWTYLGLVVNEFTTSKYDEDDGLDFLRGRGFQTDRAWIGYSFAFLIPFSAICSLVLGYALKKARFEPTKPNASTHVDTEVAADTFDIKSFHPPAIPVDLTFSNVAYEVKASTGNETIRILNDISGFFKAGRMCALMGSSGAGKTTLMDVVAMRKESGEVLGEIKLNGFEQEKISFLRSSGYVEQFDVPTPELTVRETIAFSARLRLSSEDPNTREDKDKMRFVDNIIGLLELNDIEKSQVGSYEEGGLTFEQRKRLAIAVELAGSPSIIFLDEPTSGLDARAALLVMRLLKRIADTGRTVCSTVHQPSSAVFEMFDDLLLLKTGGRTVFFGELGENSVHLIDYFESRGATPIEHGENPSSWMLRALAEKDDWDATYASSDNYEATMTEISEMNESPDEAKKIHFDAQYPTTLKQRIHLQYRRINMIYTRSPAYNLTRVIISILYAFLIGSVFLAKTLRNEEWTENQVEGVLGTIFLSLISIGVTCITMVVPVMKQIRDVFYKHRASGMIEHGPLTLSLSLGEAPYICLISVLFSAVYYATVGLFEGVANFSLFWVFFTLNLAVYAYLGQSFMCLVKDIPTAGALMGALIGYNVFFSGFIVKPQYFVGPFQLGYWTAPGRFAYEGIVVSQFHNVDVTVVAENGSPYFFSLNCTLNEPCSGNMKSYVGFSFGGRFTPDNFGIDVGILLGYVVLAWLLTHFALKKFNYVNT